MDIKDFILIGGGLLIAAVVAHGFWTAWRARRDPLRIDLVTDFPADDDDGDDLRHLRGELPNGGARVVRGGEPRQETLGLEPDVGDAPMLLETERAGRGAPRSGERRTEPRVDATPRGRTAEPAPSREPRLEEPTAEGAAVGFDEPVPEAPAQRANPRGRVADVILPERTVRADDPREARGARARKAAPEAEAPVRATDTREVPAARARGAERPAERSRPARGGVQGGEPRKPEPAVDELIMINVLAPKGAPFTGGGVVEALRLRGLRYGDMNIFHRVDPMTRATLYSVANVVEPGTFDLSDLDSFRSPGVCFFMKLPGPEQPLDVFEDMLKVARDVAVRTGGELKDEQRSVMTGQTVEHYRQRISDFCRRRMSMRA